MPVSTGIAPHELVGDVVDVIGAVERELVEPLLVHEVLAPPRPGCEATSVVSHATGLAVGAEAGAHDLQVGGAIEVAPQVLLARADELDRLFTSRAISAVSTMMSGLEPAAEAAAEIGLAAGGCSLFSVLSAPATAAGRTSGTGSGVRCRRRRLEAGHAVHRSICIGRRIRGERRLVLRAAPPIAALTRPARASSGAPGLPGLGELPKIVSLLTAALGPASQVTFSARRAFDGRLVARRHDRDSSAASTVPT